MKVTRQQFFDVYASKLIEAKLKHPEEYAWEQEEFDRVFEKMKSAFISNTFNINGNAIRATCRALKIKYNYKSIREVINNNGE